MYRIKFNIEMKFHCEHFSPYVVFFSLILNVTLIFIYWTIQVREEGYKGVRINYLYWKETLKFWLIISSFNTSKWMLQYKLRKLCKYKQSLTYTLFCSLLAISLTELMLRTACLFPAFQLGHLTSLPLKIKTNCSLIYLNEIMWLLMR